VELYFIKSSTYLFEIEFISLYTILSFFLYNIFKELYNNYRKRKEVSEMLFSPKEKGQGLVEYALILVLVAVVVIAVLTLLGPIIGNVFSKINSAVNK
jgi:pilus assembly protein Flp/PilA